MMDDINVLDYYWSVNKMLEMIDQDKNEVRLALFICFPPLSPHPKAEPSDDKLRVQKP